MNIKNKVATVIASIIVGAAVVTGSVYAAVTASQDKEEPKSSTVITTQEETVSETSTEAISDITEPTTVSKPTATITTTTKSQAVPTSSTPSNTTEFDPNYISPEHYNSMTPQQKEISYQHELKLIESMYQDTLKTSEEIRMELPEPPAENASQYDIDKYNRIVKEYTAINNRADEIRQMAEETRTRMINELNQKYGR